MKDLKVSRDIESTRIIWQVRHVLEIHPQEVSRCAHDKHAVDDDDVDGGACEIEDLAEEAARLDEGVEQAQYGDVAKDDKAETNAA